MIIAYDRHLQSSLTIVTWDHHNMFIVEATDYIFFRCSVTDVSVRHLLDVVVEGQLLSSDLKIVLKSETFDAGAGNFIVRYKIYRTFKTFRISVTVKTGKDKRKHVTGSPGVNVIKLFSSVADDESK
jgi:hypothetical protein